MQGPADVDPEWVLLLRLSGVFRRTVFLILSGFPFRLRDLSSSQTSCQEPDRNRYSASSPPSRNPGNYVQPRARATSLLEECTAAAIEADSSMNA